MLIVPTPLVEGVFPPYKENEDDPDCTANLSGASNRHWLSVACPVGAYTYRMFYPPLLKRVDLAVMHSTELCSPENWILGSTCERGL